MTMTMNPMAAAANAAASPSAATAPGLPPGNATGGKADRAGTADGTAAPAVVLPFAPLMAPAGERDAAQPQGADASGGSADGNVDVLDAALMQALDELLGRGPAASAGQDAIGVVAGGARPAGDGTEGETSAAQDAALPGSASTPLMAMLMPTLIPVVMPPTPVARDAAGASGYPAGAASNALASPSTRSSQGATTLPSALTTDAARLLALQGSDVAVPANATDAGSWQGLQRWSADLMTTMTSGAMSGGADVDASASSTLTLPASREAWQQPLMQALGDRLQLQIAQRADSARLHLEPPQLGRIEIDIRQQGGALQVQLSASNDDVRQQLRQIAEPLRHELVQRHSGDVSVQVASGAQAAGDGRGRDGAAAGGQPQSGGQQRDAQRQPGRALQDDDHGASGASAAFGFADALAGNAAGAGGVGAMGITGGNTVGNTRTTR